MEMKATAALRFLRSSIAMLKTTAGDMDLHCDTDDRPMRPRFTRLRNGTIDKLVNIYSTGFTQNSSRSFIMSYLSQLTLGALQTG